jgi:hypothetical protein
VKKELTVSLAGVALAATLSLVDADSFKRGPTIATDALPVDDVASAAAGNAYAPPYTGVARIIHVPQRGERDERASINDRDEPVTPFPRHRTTPRWPLHGDAPSLPLGSRRNVQSAAPSLAEGPTPIRPTPRFNAKAADVDKSSAPDNAAAASDVSTPPFDNTLPRGN